jgi:hypothetical protein
LIDKEEQFMVILEKIKEGDSLTALRKESFEQDNLIIGESLPSFCNSQWKQCYDLNDRKNVLYVCTLRDKARTIIHITKDYSVAVDAEKAWRNLNFILDNV